MPYLTAEHKKRKEECVILLESVAYVCVLEALGLLDLDENEIVLLLTFAVAATGCMSQESRPPLIPIDPFIQKDDLQFQFLDSQKKR